MSETSRITKATLSVENTFCDPLQCMGVFNFSLSGTFTATVTIQRRFFDFDTDDWEPTWKDLETYIAPKEEGGYQAEEGVQYRAGIKTGDYTSGSASVRISQ